MDRDRTASHWCRADSILQLIPRESFLSHPPTLVSLDILSKGLILTGWDVDELLSFSRDHFLSSSYCWERLYLAARRGLI